MNRNKKKVEIFNREQLEKMSVETLTDIIMLQQKAMEDLETKVNWLTEQVNLSRAKMYGRSTDTPNDQLMFIFNEAEDTVEIGIREGGIEEPEIETVVKSYKRVPKKKGKRATDLSGLPVQRIEHTISNEELGTLFDGKCRKLKDEVYQTLNYRPAVFEVLEHHIAIYAGKKDGEDRIVRAEHPVELLKHSVATPSLAAAIINAKYVNAVPTHRIEQEFKRNGITLSKQVMCGWMIKLAERYLSLAYDRMHTELLKSHVIHADETVVQVNKDGRKAGSESRMWVYCRENDKKIVLYDYQKTRNSTHPKEFLSGYDGWLVTDGYEVYHKLDRDIDTIHVSGCWAHCQRLFADALKGKSESSPTGVAALGVSQIKNIFHMDNKLKDLTPEERQKERNLVLAPLVDAFFAWCREKQSEIPKKSLTGKALQYSLNQETYLRRFLDDPAIPLDNNVAERKIRPFTVGRKNWQMIDTIAGAQSSAILYSIAETAKVNKLKPYEYFKHLLTEIPKHMDDTSLEFLDELMPWSESLPAECRQGK